jgi:aspartyl-tRNA(Asn)/glutamyl-tRNA(Gln) amidotransferase subunit A
LLNLGTLHLGSDGAGSIRIPAAFTGVFGIKPSYGRVPTYPASAFGALAHQGPLTRTVTDAALMLSVIAAPDGRDMTAWNSPAPDFRIGLNEGVRGLRIAWSPRLGYVRNLDSEVEAATAQAARVFEDLGAIVEEADPGFADPIDMIRTAWGAVSATIVDAVPEMDRAKMDQGFLRVAQQGRRYGLGEYLATYPARTEMAIAMARFHAQYDLLLTPQMPLTAFAVSHEAPPDGRFGDEWINWSPYTYPFNFTQQPAASVPCGFSSDGLPIGLQIVGPARRDDLVLRAARAFESAQPFAVLDAPRAN